MSHFTLVKTQLRDLEKIKTALTDLGYTVKPAGVVRGYRHNTVAADIVVDTGTAYDLGFIKKGDNVELVADFWGLKLDRQEFLNTVTQRYAYLVVLEQAQARGFDTVAEEIQPDGSIRLVMQRWG